MQAQKSILHQHARNLAQAGWPVFPCVANGKAPACPGGYKDATTSLDTIDQWWTDDPNFNIAICPEDVGLCVADVDPGADPRSWPETYTVSTPRDGRHYYYAGSLPPTASKIADKIDTRGQRSYVLVPPSYVIDKEKGIDGGYALIDDRDFAPIPGAIKAAVETRVDKAVASLEQLDLPGNVDRGAHLVRDCVRRGDVAVSGRGGDNRTYQLACELRNLGLSSEAVLSLMLEWNSHCVPPWSVDELRVKIQNASQYAQNEAGAWAVAPAAEVFGAVLDKLPQDTEPVHRSPFHAEDDEEQDQAPDPVWLIPDLIPDAATVLCIGAKGSFKSFVAQEILMSIAANAETFGRKPVRQGPTFYGAHEGRNAIKKPRKRAWKVAHGIEHSLPFFVMRAPQVQSSDQCEQFREQIRIRLREPECLKIGAIVLDTVAKCMVGLNENDARDCGLFSAFCDSLRDEFECPVIALHHFGKDEARGGRGSSALPANFDTVITCRRHEKSLSLEVSVQYHKDADEPDHPWTFEGRAIGGSLVFFPTTPEEHRSNTQSAELFPPKRVGAALASLGAQGLASAVTSHVLAAALIPPTQDETTEARTEAGDRASKALAKLARGKLEPYCHWQGRELLWCLPSSE